MCTQTERVSARALWEIPLEGREMLPVDAFASPQRERLSLEEWGDRPRVPHCSGIPRVQQTGEFPAQRGPTQGEGAGPGELQGAPFGPLLTGPQERGFNHSNVSSWPRFASIAFSESVRTGMLCH